MKFERFKSILLIMLVISSIILTANKWFDEELWPEGHSFFSNVKSKLTGKDSPESFSPNEEILKPAKIIVNNLSTHILYTKSSDKYEDVCSDIFKALASAFESGQKSMADIEEWNNRLKEKSCYFSYPVTYDAAYFSSQLSKTYSGEVNYFKEFVLSDDVRIPSVKYLYIKDSHTGKIEKIRMEFETQTINRLIESAKNESNDINYYSFELNFDNSVEGGVKNHVVIDHGVLINISEKSLSPVNERNILSNIALSEKLYTDILSIFEYNTSSIRKYIESDNSMVFVENYGTLKLHSNGVLDYKSVDNTMGIKLDDSSLNSCLNSCITFVNNLVGLMQNDKSMYYEISSDVHDIKTNSFTLTFDYYINDSKIIIPKERFDTDSAITVTVENGKIVSYNQIFSTYSASEGEINCGSAIDAIDRLETYSAKENISITDIFVAYSYNNALKTWQPLWYIEDSEGNVSAISSNAEVE